MNADGGNAHRQRRAEPAGFRTSTVTRRNSQSQGLLLLRSFSIRSILMVQPLSDDLGSTSPVNAGCVYQQTVACHRANRFARPSIANTESFEVGNHIEMIIILMGVSGSGKTTVGCLLAARLGCIFVDADSFHGPANIDKMTHGIPLTDVDRTSWLAVIHERIEHSFQMDEPLVVACSALKQQYRNILGGGVRVTWVYLKGSQEILHERLQQRQHHFMKAHMLASQLADLEEPSDAIVIDISVEPSLTADQIHHAIARRGVSLELSSL